MKVFIPPIKCQGIKSKLVLWIKSYILDLNYHTWYEPFMGSGVVGFNIRPKNAIYSDSNPHIINFYNSIKNKDITPFIARDFLENEGSKLSKDGQNYYNFIRSRFNKDGNPLDFLFLNRSCFNGMIRFNSKGEFNVPYGHKPNRFSKGYITKITNQIDYVAKAVEMFDWQFICADFAKALENISDNSIVYCDPPYLGRHTDYYDSWSEENELLLFNTLNKMKSKFIVSTWHSNDFRKNSELDKYKDFNIFTKDHFYHLGADEKNRNPMKEALIMNFQKVRSIKSSYQATSYSSSDCLRQEAFL